MYCHPSFNFSALHFRIWAVGSYCFFIVIHSRRIWKKPKNHIINIRFFIHMELDFCGYMVYIYEYRFGREVEVPLEQVWRKTEAQKVSVFLLYSRKDLYIHIQT
jgi:hypothetical protein